MSHDKGDDAFEVNRPTPNTNRNNPNGNGTIPPTGTIDTGLACCDGHRLHFQPEYNRCFCFACTPAGVDIETLPEQVQEMILKAVLYV